jgi:hypothetical protein
VSNCWAIRLEFTTALFNESTGPALPSEEDQQPAKTFVPTRPELLTTYHEDDRGRLAAAVQEVSCESFDCVINLDMYPTNQDLKGLDMGIASRSSYVL